MAREEDAQMTLDALNQVTDAIARGHLPADLVIHRYWHEVRLSMEYPSAVPEPVYEVLREMFPGGEEKLSRREAKRDLYEYVLDLRPEKETGRFVIDAVPRVEVSFVSRPHQCGEWRGAIVDDKPVWKCRDCNKRMGKREARKRGLIV